MLPQLSRVDTFQMWLIHRVLIDTWADSKLSLMKTLTFWYLVMHIYKWIGLSLVEVLGWHMLCPDSKGCGANMGPAWVLSAPDGTHVGPWNLLSGRSCLIVFTAPFPGNASNAKFDCFSFIAWTISWVNNWDASDLRHLNTHVSSFWWKSTRREIQNQRLPKSPDDE